MDEGIEVVEDEETRKTRAQFHQMVGFEQQKQLKNLFAEKLSWRYFLFENCLQPSQKLKIDESKQLQAK